MAFLLAASLVIVGHYQDEEFRLQQAKERKRAISEWIYTYRHSQFGEPLRTMRSAQSLDAVPKATAISKQAGIPEDVAARNLQEATPAPVTQHANDLATNNPELAQWITAPRNAVVAHDDLPVLTTLEHTLRVMQAGPNGDLTGTLPPGFIYTKDGDIQEVGPNGTILGVYHNLDSLVKELERRLR